MRFASATKWSICVFMGMPFTKKTNANETRVGSYRQTWTILTPLTVSSRQARCPLCLRRRMCRFWFCRFIRFIQNWLLTNCRLTTIRGSAVWGRWVFWTSWLSWGSDSRWRTARTWQSPAWGECANIYVSYFAWISGPSDGSKRT